MLKLTQTVYNALFFENLIHEAQLYPASGILLNPISGSWWFRVWKFGSHFCPGKGKVVPVLN